MRYGAAGGFASKGDKCPKLAGDLYLPVIRSILDENQAQILYLFTLFTSVHSIYKNNYDFFFNVATVL